jgi:hypothetical protein
VSVSETEPLEVFLYAIRSNTTKSRYLHRLKNFFDYLGIEGDVKTQARAFVSASQEKGKNWVYANVMKFLSYHKERAERGEVSNSSVRNYYKPLKLFLEMNDIELPWKKISRGLPKGRRHAADRAPTVEEIQKLVEYPDRRIKAIVFTMCSSGIRLGAWDYLRWGNVKPIERDGIIVAATITVYAGDEEQYYSFMSPEAYNEIRKWIDFRTEHGEKLSDSSWLMRDIWNAEQRARGMVTAPKKLKASGVKRLIERALKAQGIRKSLEQGQRRHEFQADHGFRKFFKTHAEQVMRPINVETLMGHSTGISDSYYRPNERELLEDYLKAIPDLTILPENQQHLQITKQEARISELEKSQAKIKELEDGMNLLGGLFAEQLVKGNIRRELDHPTHHHTKTQIKSLKEYSSSPPLAEAWEEFMKWANIDPKLLAERKKKD